MTFWKLRTHYIIQEIIPIVKLWVDNANVRNLESVCVALHTIDVSNVVSGLILNSNPTFDPSLALHINYEHRVVLFGLNDCGFRHVTL